MSVTQKVVNPTTNVLNIVLRFGDDSRLILDRRIEFNSLTTAAELTKRLIEKDEAIVMSGVLEHVGHEHGTIKVDGQIIAVWRNEQIDGDLEGQLSQISHKISDQDDDDDDLNWKSLYEW